MLKAIEYATKAVSAPLKISKIKGKTAQHDFLWSLHIVSPVWSKITLNWAKGQRGRKNKAQ
jgi:hypothetical protein